MRRAVREHAHRNLVGYVTGQPVDAAGACYETDARLWQADFGVFGGNDNVACHCKLKTAAERVPVDRCYDGLPALEV